MNKMKSAEQIAFIVLFYITVIGAINWGAHAIGYNLVEKLSGVAGEHAVAVEHGIYYFVAACGIAAAVMYSYHLYQSEQKQK